MGESRKIDWHMDFISKTRSKTQMFNKPHGKCHILIDFIH